MIKHCDNMYLTAFRVEGSTQLDLGELEFKYHTYLGFLHPLLLWFARLDHCNDSCQNNNRALID